jgi:hypothetical protein
MFEVKRVAVWGVLGAMTALLAVISLIGPMGWPY